MHEKGGIFWVPNHSEWVKLGDISSQIRRYRVFWSKKWLKVLNVKDGESLVQFLYDPWMSNGMKKGVFFDFLTSVNGWIRRYSISNPTIRVFWSQKWPKG